MNRWKLTKKGKVMLWTYYSQNGLNWMESDEGGYLKVKDLMHAQEIINNQHAWDVEVLYDYSEE